MAENTSLALSNPSTITDLPNGWTVARIEDVCRKVTSGGTPSRSNPAFYRNGTIDWYKTGELKDGWLEGSEEKITSEAVASSSAKVFPINTVLLALYGDGKTITSLGLLRRPGATNQACCAMIVDPAICDHRFLFYSLKLHRADLIFIASGGAQRNLSGKLMRDFGIRLPPLPEQRAIAGVLGALDDKIEVNRKTARVLEGIARAVFTSWFVDFDPVRYNIRQREHAALGRAGRFISTGDDITISDPSGKVIHRAGDAAQGPIAHLFPDRLVDSAIGEVPEGWRVEGLDASIKFLNGLALQKFPPKDGRSLPVIKIAQLRKGDTDGADRASADLDPEYIVHDGDVLFSWSGSLECVLWAGGPGALNQHLFKVTSATLPKWFYYLWVHHHLPDFRHIAAGKATTMGHIQRHHLTQALVTVPSDPRLMQAMDQFFAPLIDALCVRAVQNRTLAALRDALLPKLISGELRIESAEKIVGRAVDG